MDGLIIIVDRILYHTDSLKMAMVSQMIALNKISLCPNIIHYSVLHLDNTDLNLLDLKKINMTILCLYRGSFQYIQYCLTPEHAVVKV